MPGIGTLLRTERGIVIKRLIINVRIIARHMQLTGIAAHEIGRLLNPWDGQDVPVAIELVTALELVATASRDGLNPLEMQERDALYVFAQLFGGFVRGFCDAAVHWSVRLYSSRATLCCQSCSTVRKRAAS
jgi:hypothetical protein